jgi:NAD(P)-dependent dehydrogenase (short-subunit alcohol dehydrogenase family)
MNYAGNERAAAETVAAVTDAGGRALALRGDVAAEADVIAMFDATHAAFGTLDGLVNNAGIVAPGSKLADMSAARMARVFAVNVLGAYLCAREAARRMAKDRGGRGGAIVNISSAASRLGSPGEYVDYAGSKGAVDTMTIGLAKELGPAGVRVNAIRPGVIETEIHASGRPPTAPRHWDRPCRSAAPAHPRRGRGGDRVAAQRRRVLRDRRDIGCDGRAVATRVSCRGRPSAGPRGRSPRVAPVAPSPAFGRPRRAESGGSLCDPPHPPLRKHGGSGLTPP